jgi:hypothetical protein
MLFNIFVICVLFCFIIWFYYVKHQEADKQYSTLHGEYMNLCNENQKLKTRLKDLQSYKNDVSKTFKILDNELLLINDRLQNRDSNLNTPQPNPISVLTPELLTSLFNNMNQEFSDYSPSFGDLGNINLETHTPIEELNNYPNLENNLENIASEPRIGSVDQDSPNLGNLMGISHKGASHITEGSPNLGTIEQNNTIGENEFNNILNKEDYSQYLIDN